MNGIFTQIDSESSSTKIIRWISFILGITIFIAIIVIAVILKLQKPSLEFSASFYTFSGSVITLIIGITQAAYSHAKSLNNTTTNQTVKGSGGDLIK